MTNTEDTFFTSIGCMDGRVLEPVNEYGRQRYGVLFVDTITEAGLVGTLTNNPSVEVLDSIEQQVLISVGEHRSKGIIVHGHQDCAGNPVDDRLHKEQTVEAANVIRNFVASDIEVKPVFVSKTENGWKVEEL